MAISPLLKSTHAGLFATSSAMADRSGPMRLAYRPSSRLMLPVALQDVPRLLDESFDEQRGDAHRFARVTAAAQCKSMDPDRKTRTAYDLEGLPRRLTSAKERERLLEKKERARGLDLGFGANAAEAALSEEICRYCTLFDELFHDFDLPTIAVVNHGARIDLKFSPETNISEARIDNYQLLLPQELAIEALQNTHPLLWDQAAPESFVETSAATPNGRPPRQTWDVVTDRSERAMADWESQAQHENFTFEHAIWPLNEHLSTQIQNILKIRNFVDATTDATRLGAAFKLDAQHPQAVGDAITSLMNRDHRGPNGTGIALEPLLSSRASTARLPQDRLRALSYRYSLESCLRSSYGIGSEDYSGLNLDDGSVANVAVHWSQLTPDYVSHLTQEDLLHLHRELVRHLAGRAQAEVAQIAALIAGDVRSPPARAETNLQVVQGIARLFETICWEGKEVWLLSVSSSKRLRFTVPVRGPVELWSALTWMGPAILYSFMNRAVCQLPHFLLKKERQKRRNASTV